MRSLPVVPTGSLEFKGGEDFVLGWSFILCSSADSGYVQTSTDAVATGLALWPGQREHPPGLLEIDMSPSFIFAMFILPAAIIMAAIWLASSVKKGRRQ